MGLKELKALAKKEKVNFPKNANKEKMLELLEAAGLIESAVLGEGESIPEEAVVEEVAIQGVEASEIETVSLPKVQKPMKTIQHYLGKCVKTGEDLYQEISV